MKIGNLINNKLTGKTVDLLSRALDFRSANHSVIAGNLANIDTPGYKPKELSFNKELRKVMDKRAIPLRKTDPKHFSYLNNGFSNGRGSFTIKTRDMATDKSDKLNIDSEMAKMVQNNLLYEATVKLIAKKFEALKTAIDSGRS